MPSAEELSRLVASAVAPVAADADRLARFPRAALTSLSRKGVLALTSSRRLGGGGHGLAEAARVVELVARACASTATVLRSHFASVAVLEAHGDQAVRAELAAGRHLSTLALFDAGPGSRLLAPGGVACAHDGVVDLHGGKAGVVAAGEADSYVWSSRPAGGRGAATLWFVPGHAPGLFVPALPGGGLGLRACAATTVRADPVQLPENTVLGGDGAGADVVLDLALPWFLGLGAAVAQGIAESAIERTAAHAAAGACAPGEPRAELARMRLRAAAVRVLTGDAFATYSWDPAHALPKLFHLWLASAEAVVAVTEQSLRLCAGAAFPGDAALERCFRDARAHCSLEPTVDTVVDLAARAGGEIAAGPAFGELPLAR
ncbi:acyl-CoA dehydrogenase family protein [Amycolatopsis sp. FDAARGOS 1241]|uniref:acyl-CoA dehydrogenase family protein n=1 Tax=Amycolatopsis sp. FDAARGOS 1241 TaxID=2778070 RepID=UPI00194EB5E9|nr:acyl-CoA dehydrogenase family protein [Amycolatopsis sp. FDAARGOS 1241]QRP49863.1 acyl-CoA/acyl-ACP dehydrogenase [Amycolatopsis sp. FDAARGOS 1241]